MPASYKTVFGPLSRSGWVANANDQTYGAASNAIDGNNSTLWATSGSFPAWLTLDMLTPQTFDTATMFPRQDGNADFPGSIELYVSTDGTTWGTAIFTQSGLANDATLKTFSFTSQTKRYLKYNILSQASGARIYSGCAEFNVGIQVPQYVTAGNPLVISGAGSGAFHQKIKGPPFSTGGGNRGFSG